MVLGTNSLRPQNKIFFIKKFSNSLLFKLTAYLVVFTTILIVIFFNYLNQPYVEDDTLDAQEGYLYAQMIESWGSPPDTNKVNSDIGNLSLNCAIFKLEQDWNLDRGWGDSYWKSDSTFPSGDFFAISEQQDFIDQGVDLPFNVQHGLIGIESYTWYGSPQIINEIAAIAAEYKGYVYYFGTNYSTPGIEYDLLISLFAIIVLVSILYFSLRNFLYPVLLMKQRVHEFENGDLDSTIPVSGEDELASLAKSVNKMTENIKILLNQKQMLLLDVSHELRTPLARMQLLVEMIPDHKNIIKLKEEIALLEGIISNLLLSDKLSTPYRELQISKISANELIEEVKKMFPDNNNQIKIINEIPHVMVNVDELKMTLAIRNLLDNAIKYSKKSNKPTELSFELNSNFLLISIKDFGKGIKSKNIKELTKPFYRVGDEDNVKGFGIGLTIVKKVIEAHSGELIIKSKYNEGSNFILKIPYIQSK